MAAPIVFVSHASEDKDRFVLGFATKLRQQGIEAWVDQWEILPGDSLVDRIFEEGLKNACAVIVVISTYSVSKPWVREEINTAVVNRISKQTKIIPVVIDKCEVPEALRSTVWQAISDVNRYDAELKRIVMAIYGTSERPPLGSAPAYAHLSIDELPGLTTVDTTVMKVACERVFEQGDHLLTVDQVVKSLQQLEVPREAVIDSLEVLDGQGYVAIDRSFNGPVAFFRVTTIGLEVYARQFIDHYDDVLRNVGLEIVNGAKREAAEIASTIGQPEMLVEHVLDVMQARGLVRVAKGNGFTLVTEVKPQLKRLLSQ